MTGQSEGLDKTGIALGIIGAALFSTKPILIKFVYAHDVIPDTLMALRMGFSLPFYLILGWIAFRQRRTANISTDYSPAILVKTGILGAAAYYVASYLDLTGLTMITAQFERLILFTYPVVVAILAAFFLGSRFTLKTALSLSLTYIGIAIIFTHDLKSLGSDIVTGAALVFGAAVIFAFYVVFSKAMIAKLGSRIFTSFSMTIASFVIITHFLIFNDISQLVVDWQVYGLTLTIAVFSTVLPSFFIAESISRIGPGPASILGSVGPVFTTIMAITILGEDFTLAHFAGTVLIIAGIAWLSKPDQRSV